MSVAIIEPDLRAAFRSVASQLSETNWQLVPSATCAPLLRTGCASVASSSVSARSSRSQEFQRYASRRYASSVRALAFLVENSDFAVPRPPRSQLLQKNWTWLPSYPIGVGESQGTIVNGELVVVGGYISTTEYHVTNAVHALNVSNPNRGWRRLPDSPFAFTHAAQAVIGPILYMCGGYKGTHIVALQYLVAVVVGSCHASAEGVRWARLTCVPILFVSVFHREASWSSYV